MRQAGVTLGLGRAFAGETLAYQPEHRQHDGRPGERRHPIPDGHAVGTTFAMRGGLFDFVAAPRKGTSGAATSLAGRRDRVGLARRRANVLITVASHAGELRAQVRREPRLPRRERVGFGTMVPPPAVGLRFRYGAAAHAVVAGRSTSARSETRPRAVPTTTGGRRRTGGAGVVGIVKKKKKKKKVSGGGGNKEYGEVWGKKEWWGKDGS